MRQFLGIAAVQTAEDKCAVGCLVPIDTAGRRLGPAAAMELLLGPAVLGSAFGFAAARPCVSWWLIPACLAGPWLRVSICATFRHVPHSSLHLPCTFPAATTSSGRGRRCWSCRARTTTTRTACCPGGCWPLGAAAPGCCCPWPGRACTWSCCACSWPLPLWSLPRHHQWQTRRQRPTRGWHPTFHHFPLFHPDPSSAVPISKNHRHAGWRRITPARFVATSCPLRILRWRHAGGSAPTRQRRRAAAAAAPAGRRLGSSSAAAPLLGEAAIAWLTCCPTFLPAGTAFVVTTVMGAARQQRRRRTSDPRTPGPKLLLLPAAAETTPGLLPSRRQGIPPLGPAAGQLHPLGEAMARPRCASAGRLLPWRPSVACVATRRPQQQQRGGRAPPRPRRRLPHPARALPPTSCHRIQRRSSSAGSRQRRKRSREAARSQAPLRGACWERCWAAL